MMYCSASIFLFKDAQFYQKRLLGMVVFPNISKSIKIVTRAFRTFSEGLKGMVRKSFSWELRSALKT